MSRTPLHTPQAASSQAASSQAASQAAAHAQAPGQRAYAALRRLAITYGFRPGERLNEGTLARSLDVSRTPLREAMHRLVSEGLLTLVAGRGFFARALDVKEVFDLYEARRALEVAIVQLACERASDEALDALDRYLDESVEAQESAGIERLLAYDEGFHQRLTEATGNAELARMLRNVNDRIHFFRWVDMQGRRDRTQAEHRAIVAAVRARDRAQAVELIEFHITRRLDQIVDVIRQGYARLYMGEGPQGFGQGVTADPDAASRPNAQKEET